ncbi:hypothetical protein BDK92_6629 [Micromonospora pisi]|uniref:Uncharacterized protein n=1 Tax=Micromonospora pisi TaxID=589240 RepID=A0A495JUI2_9ACTN|nr:hypothetical protein [Micromonospora pisi]RKR92195.1 hypothetical protein BDK92_6629 [Micromonospora pisi]
MEASESLKGVQAKRLALAVVAAAALGGAVAVPVLAADHSHDSSSQQVEAWDRDMHGEPYYI